MNIKKDPSTPLSSSKHVFKVSSTRLLKLRQPAPICGNIDNLRVPTIRNTLRTKKMTIIFWIISATLHTSSCIFTTLLSCSKSITVRIIWAFSLDYAISACHVTNYGLEYLGEPSRKISLEVYEKEGGGQCSRNHIRTILSQSYWLCYRMNGQVIYSATASAKR